jgi:4'-phosphopantetheinyl transferase EntD
MFETVAPAPPGLNPAEISAALEALFPPGVVAAELHGAAPAGFLTESETAAVSHCAPKRIGDFTAGRLCARRALEASGVLNFALLPAADRQPLWPEGYVGSITHTEGYSAAVVGRRARFLSIGIDAETIASVHAELWPRILGEAELRQLMLVGEPQARERAAALIFAAKEAFYKCQYAVTAEWLEFEDLHIESPDFGRDTGLFSVRPCRPLRLRHSGSALEGRFRVHAPYVSCGVALPV